MGRKLRTVHEAMLPKKTLRKRKRVSKKNGFAINIPVYARDYRLGRQWQLRLSKKAWEHESRVIDQVMVPPRTARTRWKPSSL
ncbi:hypothetical protein ACTXT7_001931 [Hymenolepis weldensis]